MATTNPGQFIKLEPSDLLTSIGIDGILYDETKAKQGPCKCVPTPRGKDLCWDPGIIGALSQEQVKTYCKDNMVEKKLPARLNSQMIKFSDASQACEVGKTYNTPEGNKKISGIEDRLECMHIEASKEA